MRIFLFNAKLKIERLCEHELSSETSNDRESYICNQINKHNSHELSEKWQERKKVKFHPQISSHNLYTIGFGRLSVNILAVKVLIYPTNMYFFIAVREAVCNDMP